MSADNGIYVLRTNKPPIKEGGFYTNQHCIYEYRVAHCQAINNLDYSDLYMPLLFGDSLIYKNDSAAFIHANQLAAKIGICNLEYGIQLIKINKYFPNMTAKAAAKSLDCYVGAEPLDYTDMKNPVPFSQLKKGDRFQFFFEVNKFEYEYLGENKIKLINAPYAQQIGHIDNINPTGDAAKDGVIIFG